MAVSAAIALTLAFIQQSKIKPTYQASARVLVLQQGGQPLNVGGKGGDLFSSRGTITRIRSRRTS